jgi:hypothetical protein
MNIDIHVAGIDATQAMLAKVGQASDAAIRGLAQRIYDLSERGADKHTKTGALFRSIYIKSAPGGWEVGHDLQMAPHAIFVHWGTKPHLIKPKTKKAPRWTAGNRWAFAKVVHHPGYKGDPWLVTAANKALTEFPKMIAKHLKGS